MNANVKYPVFLGLRLPGYRVPEVSHEDEGHIVNETATEKMKRAMNDEIMRLDGQNQDLHIRIMEMRASIFRMEATISDNSLVMKEARKVIYNLDPDAKKADDEIDAQISDFEAELKINLGAPVEGEAA